MSSILEALERAEQERNARGPVTLREPISRPKVRWRRPLPWLFGGALLLINLLVWWLLVDHEEVTQVAETTERSRSEAATASTTKAPLLAEAQVAARTAPPVSQPAKVTVAKPVEPQRPTRQATRESRPLREEAASVRESVVPSPVSVEPQPKVTEATLKQATSPQIPQPAAVETPIASISESVVAKSTPVVVPGDKKAPSASTKSPPVVAALEPESNPAVVPGDKKTPSASTKSPPVVAVVKPESNPQPEDEPALAKVEAEPKASPEPEEKPAEEYIPRIWELPGSEQKRLKDLKVNIHVYNEIPEERFVIIEMRRYREGDSLGRPGLKLERITRDGVVIDYGKGLVKL